MSNTLSKYEQELLIRYRKQRKRKRIVLTVCIVAFLLIGGGYYVISNQQETIAETKAKVKKDTIHPVLQLSTEKIEIEQGTVLDYMSYVLEATDSKDGELKEKVQYNKIDTNITGEFTIVYKVKDKAGNEAKAELTVKIYEIRKAETPAETPQNEIPLQSEQTPVHTDHATQPPAMPPLPTQFFLFSEGYNMSNVSTACADALKSSGRSGVCSPIQDENGIYLGMRLDYD